MRKFWDNIYLKIFIISLFATFATFLVAFLGFFIYKKHLPLSITAFGGWDSAHYLYIAEHGYCNLGCGKTEAMLFIVFFPLYPFFVRIFHFFVRNYMLSSLIVSNISYTLAVFFLYKLVKKDFSHEISLRTILLLSAFPTAYFLHVGYTEGLFLLLVVSSFYYAVNGKWLTASLLGMLASLTRINGILLFPALIIEYLIGKKETNGERSGKKIKGDILYTSLIPLGFLVYLLINYMYFHNPFQFMIFQRDHWGEYFSSPINGFMGAVKGFSWRPFDDWISWEFPQILFAVFALIIILFSLKKARASYSVFSVLSLIIILCSSFWISVPRFVVVVFPIFIYLAILARRALYFYPIIFFFLIAQIFFMTRFLAGQWAF